MQGKRTLEERFWAKVQKTDSCWLWTGAKNPNGYGVINAGGQFGPMLYVHRVACEIAHGPIPDGYEVDHLCRNTLCVNPAHLEAVTPRENVLRSRAPSAIHAKKTHCPEGHPLSGDNLYSYRGARLCKECRRRQCREYQARRRKDSHTA